MKTRHARSLTLFPLKIFDLRVRVKHFTVTRFTINKNVKTQNIFNFILILEST